MMDFGRGPAESSHRNRAAAVGGAEGHEDGETERAHQDAETTGEREEGEAGTCQAGAAEGGRVGARRGAARNGTCVVRTRTGDEVASTLVAEKARERIVVGLSSMTSISMGTIESRDARLPWRGIVEGVGQARASRLTSRSTRSRRSVVANDDQFAKKNVQRCPPVSHVAQVPEDTTTREGPHQRRPPPTNVEHERRDHRPVRRRRRDRRATRVTVSRANRAVRAPLGRSDVACCPPPPPREDARCAAQTSPTPRRPSARSTPSSPVPRTRPPPRRCGPHATTTRARARPSHPHIIPHPTPPARPTRRVLPSSHLHQPRARRRIDRFADPSTPLAPRRSPPPPPPLLSVSPARCLTR